MLMSTIHVVVLLVCIIALSCNACDVKSFSGGQFSRCEVFDSNYDLYWRVDGEDIVFGLNIRNNAGGWVGFGLSENGGMKGADIVVAESVNGMYSMTDRFSSMYAEPIIDDHSDVVLLKTTEDTTATTITFKRKLVTCDGQQDLPILGRAQMVIYAYGGRGNGKLQYHGTVSRGKTTINFLEVEVPVPIPDSALTFDLVAPAFIVPPKETTYSCSAHVLPNDRKYHVIKVSAIVTSPLVHHIASYICTSPPPASIINQTVDCDNYHYCMQGESVFVAWGIGGTDIVYDGDYGFPMGTDGAVYVRLEIHYYNPFMMVGQLDVSGLSLIYTSQLRTYDLSSLVLGPMEDALVLPPHLAAIEVSNECQESCTRMLPATGIHIITIAAHMHLIGSKFWVQLIRGDTELERLYETNYYDFTLQIHEEINRTVYPGDRLITHCVYDTTSRVDTTYGGLSTSSEMCHAFLTYYPRLPMSTCIDLNMNLTYCPNPSGAMVENAFPRPPYNKLVEEERRCEKASVIDNFINPVAVAFYVFFVLVGLLFIGMVAFYLRRSKIDQKIKGYYKSLTSRSRSHSLVPLEEQGGEGGNEDQVGESVGVALMNGGGGGGGDSEEKHTTPFSVQ